MAFIPIIVSPFSYKEYDTILVFCQEFFMIFLLKFMFRYVIIIIRKGDKMRNIGGKKGEVFNDGVLSQIKPEGDGFKIVTHLDHLKDLLKNDVHVEDRFDIGGNYKDFTFNIKNPS